MCVIDVATVKRSEAQFQSRQSDSVDPPFRSVPSRSASSTFAPSSAIADVMLSDVLAQLQRMDAPLDTLSIKLYQVNGRVGHIARQ